MCKSQYDDIKKFFFCFSKYLAENSASIRDHWQLMGFYTCILLDKYSN
jgi:hypothetical protein